MKVRLYLFTRYVTYSYVAEQCKFYLIRYLISWSALPSKTHSWRFLWLPIINAFCGMVYILEGYFKFHELLFLKSKKDGIQTDDITTKRISVGTISFKCPKPKMKLHTTRKLFFQELYIWFTSGVWRAYRATTRPSSILDIYISSHELEFIEVNLLVWGRECFHASFKSVSWINFYDRYCNYWFYRCRGLLSYFHKCYLYVFRKIFSGVDIVIAFFMKKLVFGMKDDVIRKFSSKT